MDDAAPKGNPTADFNKIDLSQLQGFSFGTQWAKDKDSSGPSGDHRDRGGRDDRSPGPGQDRRDRRAFKRPHADPIPARSAAEGRDSRPRREDGERSPRRGPGPERFDRAPYDSPHFSAAFFPEDTSFNALVRTIRTSARTIELFEIARTVLGKPDRFVVVLSRKPRAPGAPEAPVQPIYISVPDGLPFETEDAAIAHVMGQHLSAFFDQAEAEVEPPKGNFLVISKCGVTGALLGPPNYHRYSQLVQQHFTAHVARMPFEAFKARIETVRDPEVVKEWLEKMKKVTRYTAKASQPEAAAGPSFDSLEDAKAHVLSAARDRVVRPVEHARFHGKALENIPRGEILAAIEGAYERQLRFPLDTANQLRGRLRREHFTIFKKGSKGVSYVCAVKRKFRIPGQVFSESIGRLIAFIEANALVKAGDLASRMLGVATPADGTLAPEQREKIVKMQGDLIWLVREGYVTEFIDGGLYSPPAMVEARKKEVEAEDVDPENFPEAPAAEAAPADGAPAQSAPAETASPEATLQEAAPARQAAQELPAPLSEPAAPPSVA